MKKCFILLLMLISPSFISGNDFIKEYILYLSNSQPYQNNSIIIEKIDDKKIFGKVVLDFNIGPQARYPHPWEKSYTINFNGNFESESQQISFSIKLNLHKLVTYSFKGYLIYINEKDSNKIYKAIVGEYYKNKKLIGGFFAKEKTNK